MKIVIREFDDDPTALTTTVKSTTDSTTENTIAQNLILSEVVASKKTENDGENNSNDGRWELSTTTITRAAATSSSWANMTMISTSSPRKVIQQLFLPIGYPNSVDSTYLPYQLYDGLQGLCSYWRGVVSAQAVFKASGVGDADRTAFSAAMAWALRDGTGMIGGLLYSYLASHYFDVYVKEFRLILADCINDVALTLDLVAPYFGPVYSVYILTFSTMGKTICGITAGATKGRITSHFARNNGNMADLTAKESTQETLVSLVGMIGGVWVARLLNDAPPIMTWILFGILTMIHVWANYRGVALLKLDTLNPERTRVLFQHVVDVMTKNILQLEKREGHGIENLKGAIKQMKVPNEIEESMISSIQGLVFPSIQVARPFQPNNSWCSLFYADGGDSSKPKTARDLNYVIEIDTIMNVFSKPKVCIWLKVGATMRDELQAYVHAMLIQKIVRKEDHLTEIFLATSAQIQCLFDDKTDFIDHLSSLGWDLNRLYLGYSSRRLSIVTKDE